MIYWTDTIRIRVILLLAVAGLVAGVTAHAEDNDGLNSQRLRGAIFRSTSCLT